MTIRDLNRGSEATNHDDRIGGEHPIVASKRADMEHEIGDDGQLVARRARDNHRNVPETIGRGLVC